MAMQTGTLRPKRKRGPLFWLGLIIALCLLYTAAWFAAANYATRKVEAIFDGDNALAQNLDCTGMRIAGFPFKLGLYCSNVIIHDTKNELSGTVGAFRSAAEIYRPGRISWDMDSPLAIKTSTGISTNVTWQSMRSYVTMGLKGTDSAATTLEMMQANITSPGNGMSVNSSADTAHLRFSRDGDNLSARLHFDNASLGINGSQSKLPPATIEMQMTIKNQGNRLDIDHPKPIMLRGLDGQVNTIEINAGDGRRIVASGPITIDQDGYISGQLKLGLEKVDGWRDMVIAAYPDTKDYTKMAAKGLKALFLGQNQGNVTVQITHGTVVLGFLPLGNIPPI